MHRCKSRRRFGYYRLACGSVDGAMQGEEALPDRWLRALELRETIETIATDLSTFPSWKLGENESGEFRNEIWKRYPGW